MTKYAVLPTKRRALTKTPMGKKPQEVVVFAIAFEDRYDDWFEFIRNHEDMQNTRIEFCDSDEQLAVLAESYPGCNVDIHPFDETTYDLHAGDYTWIGILWFDARKPSSHPDFPTFDMNTPAEVRDEIESKFAEEHNLPLNRKSHSSFSYLAQNAMARGSLCQSGFALLLKAGFTPNDYLRLTECLYTEPCVEIKDLTDKKLFVEERNSAWSRWQLVPEMSKCVVDCAEEDQEFVRECVRFSFTSRMYLFETLMDKGMSKEDALAWIEKEGKTNIVLSRMWRLLHDGYGKPVEEPARNGGTRFMWRQTELVGAVRTVNRRDAGKLPFIQAVLALPEDEFSFVVDALASGHSLEDLEPFVDCLDSFFAAYRKGVSIDDLLA